MVTDERNFAFAQINRAHAVCGIWHQIPIIHDVAETRYDTIIKALGEIDQVIGVTHQRAIAEHFIGSGGRCLRNRARSKTRKRNAAKAKSKLPPA